MPERPGVRPTSVISIAIRPAEPPDQRGSYVLMENNDDGAWTEFFDDLTRSEYEMLKACLSTSRSRSKMREIAHA